jgi:PAS domain S-box-containing protein
MTAIHRWPRAPRWAAYALALAATLAVLLVRAQLTSLMAHRPLIILFVLPITLSAVLGGVGPGLVATLVAAVGADLLIFEPIGFGISAPIDTVQLGLLVAVGVLISVLTEGLHRARRRAEDARALAAYGLLLRVLSERLERAQRQVQEGQALQSAILTSVGDAVIATDQQGRVTSLNARAEQLTGWCDAEAVGRPLPDVLRILHGQTRAPVLDPARQVLATSERVGLPADAVLIARDYRKLPIQGSGAPVRLGDGSPVGVVLVFRDDPAANPR